MNIVNSIVLFFAGVIGASGLITDRYPGTTNFVERVKKYALPVGVVALVLGVVKLLSLLNLGMPMIRWVTVLGTSLVMISLGLIEGYSSVKDMLQRSPELSDGAEKLRNRLWNYQEVLGILAIVLAVVNLFFCY